MKIKFIKHLKLFRKSFSQRLLNRARYSVIFKSASNIGKLEDKAKNLFLDFLQQTSSIFTVNTNTERSWKLLNYT
jgi:hypothetical protein